MMRTEPVAAGSRSKYLNHWAKKLLPTKSLFGVCCPHVKNQFLTLVIKSSSPARINEVNYYANRGWFDLWFKKFKCLGLHPTQQTYLKLFSRFPISYSHQVSGKLIASTPGGHRL